LADPVAVEMLRGRLATLNPAAVQITVAQGVIDPAAILDCGLFDGTRRIPDVGRWLNDEAVAARQHGRHCAPGCDHHDAAPGPDGPRHDRPRHDQQVSSFVVTFEQPVAWQPLAMAIEVLVSLRGENLLRVKGIVNAKDSDKPLVIHGVQHLFHPPVMLPAWPDQDRRTRIVFVTRDLPASAVETLLARAVRGEDGAALT
jgi:G3E family GTPase